MNLNKHSKVRTVGLSSSFALLALLGAAVFCPSSYDNAAHAVDQSATFELDFILQKTATATFTVDFLLAQQLSISMSDLDPNATVTTSPVATDITNQTAYKDFTVTTNSTAGLGIFVYGEGGNTLDGPNNSKISSISSAATLANMPANSWGYNLSAGAPAPSSSMEFSPVLDAKGNAAQHTDDAVTNKAYRLTFGAKVGWDKAPGTYSRQVNVQVVPNGTQTTAINEAGTMYQTMRRLGVESIDTDTYVLDIVTQKEQE